MFGSGSAAGGGAGAGSTSEGAVGQNEGSGSNSNSNNSNNSGIGGAGGNLIDESSGARITNLTASPQPVTESSPSAAEKKARRISSPSKVSSFVQSARQSLTGGIGGEKRSGNGGTPSMVENTLNNAAGDSRPTPNCSFRVGVTEDKNKKCRRTMEDTHAFVYNFLPSSTPSAQSSGDGASLLHSTMEENSKGESDNGYFAIFDGHAGTYAADWCGKKLHHILEDNIRKNPEKPIPEILDMTFTNVDKELKDLPVRNSGCTAVCAVLRWEDRPIDAASGGTAPTEPQEDAAGKPKPTTQRVRALYTANVGDARIVLCRAGKALRLSYDHKGSDENEGKRVANAGGLILNNRVNGVLAVTRALGDSYIKQLVTGHPYTTETVIQPEIDEFLILACDGLWDVCSDQEAVDHVRNVQDPQEASKMLVDHALARFSTDNLSCMIIRFDKMKEHTTVSGVGLGLIGADKTSDKAEGAAPQANEDVVMSDATTPAPLEDTKA